STQRRFGRQTAELKRVHVAGGRRRLGRSELGLYVKHEPVTTSAEGCEARCCGTSRRAAAGHGLEKGVAMAALLPSYLGAVLEGTELSRRCGTPEWVDGWGHRPRRAGAGPAGGHR